MSYRRSMSTLSMSALPSMTRSQRAASVYSGRSIQVSSASQSLRSGFDLAEALGGGDGRSVSISGNDKQTMQNLNDRLAAYLEKVRLLESANAKLERQILEWYEKQTPSVRDYSKYMVIIEDLRNKISAATLDNARVMLHIDNARLAAEDFRIKFENELAVRMSVETDIGGLRKVLDDLTMARSDLEMQVEGLKEELVFLKKNHEEELAALRNHQSSSSVNVEVDAKPQEDLGKVLEDIRSQYNGIAEKNRRDMEAWYKAKFDELGKQMQGNSETLVTSRSEINDLKRTLQALQIELQSQISLKSALEGQLVETESRYSLQMSQLQAQVDMLQDELSHIKADIENQSREYQILLNIKTRLEMEIAEYRRLLDGEDQKKAVVTNIQKTVVKEIKEVKEVVKPQPVITQRTRVVIEEIVNGEVVSRTEDVSKEVVKS